MSWSCMTSNSSSFLSTFDVVSPILDSEYYAKQLLLVCTTYGLIEILLCGCVIVFQYRTYLNFAIVFLGVTFHHSCHCVGMYYLHISLSWLACAFDLFVAL